MAEPYPLPDSTHGLWRAWCADCGEPMRVPESEARDNHYCESCRPPSAAKLGQGRRGCPLEPNEDDAHPWQEKAIREMEDRGTQ